MIKLFSGYGIDTDERNYTLTKETTRKNKDTGNKEVYNLAIGYYSTLANALKGLMQKVQREKFQEKDYTLSEAVKVINDIENDFETLLANIRETIDA